MTNVLALWDLREKEEKAYKTLQTMVEIRREKEEQGDEYAVKEMIELENYNRGRWGMLKDLIEELEAENE